jgi:hypothetical protein
VTRWTRYGHDRLYVTGGDGVRLGWVDNATGEQHLEAAARGEEFARALAIHSGGASAQEWTDLASNRPGHSARAQAQAQFAVARERSRVRSALSRALDLNTPERAWRTGADGEEAVGARLNKLVPDGWRVLHAVPVGARGSDIDHVLIGPGGVYTLNTKLHPGKRIWVSPHQVRVDGQVVPYLRNARFEAARASRLLTSHVGWEVPVRAGLVLLTRTLIPDVTIKSGGPDDVMILDRFDVPRVFKRAPRRLTDEEIEAIFQVARRSTTWSGGR